MILRFFLFLFLIFTSPVYAENPSFLMLDNQTTADYHDYVDDPFLVLRTKITPPDKPWNISISWEHFASYDIFTLPNEEDCYEAHLTDEHPLPETGNPPIILNQSQTFDHVTPYFHLSPQNGIIIWQISTDPEFKHIIPNFEGTQDSNEIIELDPLTDTFFNPDTTYYFRARSSSPWSQSFEFQVSKPDAVKDINFEKKGDHHYEISWKGSPDTRYLVFASNSLDFVPTIYSDTQINSMQNGVIVEKTQNDNLVACIESSSLEIDDSYAYYRVVAERHGKTSVPSPIIYVYDTAMSTPRDVLQQTEKGKAERIALIQSIKTKLQENSNPYITEEMWRKVTPYLMPDNHPIKAKLDRIFKEKRAIINSHTALNAGFLKCEPGQFSHCVVTKHKKVKGYFFKFFFDSQRGERDWVHLSKRALGAVSIANAIKHFGYEKIFKVPKKWIYVLPEHPSPPPEMERKNFILIAEDMNILPNKQNRAKWKSDSFGEQRLRAFYVLITDQGLNDSVHAFNVPFSKDGKLAFIDTEHNHNWMIYYDILSQYLNDRYKALWKEIVRGN